ncbi:MAG: DUF262 domain-containing protein [Gammaproteobacteria bacterium AqS3]|nr:DUF262 domain-containing protein [Gammaproteobacteria bacterium AqS3]
MQKVQSRDKSIKVLLGGTKYSLDFYQREYLWKKKQITELIDDLSEKFIDSHKEGNERTAVAKYGHYFLGPIIISERDGCKYIIDGQQRLTSLTLLLIYIHGQLNEEDRGQLANLIFSMTYGERSFNLNVKERTECMNALFTGEPLNENGHTESVANILDRYQDIEEYFPEELSGSTLPFFADWLIENVFLIEITADSDADAYTIFETMNNRGLSLTPTEMLKGYLLANITDLDMRTEANKVWQKHSARLKARGKELEADAIKSWLLSQYAKSQRRRGTGDKPQDLERIHSDFYQWVRDHKQVLKLTNSSEFFRFITKDFKFYADCYKKIEDAEVEFTKGLEAIFFNTPNVLPFQYSMLLASLKTDDSEEEVLRKLRIVSGYIDILINRQIWNLRPIGYSVNREPMFLMIKEVRMLDAKSLAQILVERLLEDKYTFARSDNFHLIRARNNRPQSIHPSGNRHRFAYTRANRRDVRQILARITDYIEIKSGRPSRYAEYVRKSENPHSIEHIWANDYDRHSDEFESQSEFELYRNRIGGLLLLPEMFNMNYGNLPYEEKLPYYIKHNLLAQSLHEQAYENDSEFKKFIEESELEFKPHSQFKKADLDARQLLYQKIAEQIWNPENLLKEAESEAI